METEMWICEGAKVVVRELRLPDCLWWCLFGFFFCIQAAFLGISYPVVKGPENQ